MAETIQLEIVTPRGSVVSTSAEEVVLPGVQGEFGVLPGHVPFVSSLVPGVLTYRAGQLLQRVAIWTGFAQVADENRLLVLADACATKNDVDAIEIERELKETQTRIDSWDGPLDAEYQALSSRVAWARARLDLAAG